MHATAARTARYAGRFPFYRAAGFYRACVADNLGVAGAPPLFRRQYMRFDQR